jgi:hypothetical protein
LLEPIRLPAESEFRGANLSGARFVESNLSGVVMRGFGIAGSDIDAPWLFEDGSVLRVNDVEVAPFVDAELNRRTAVGRGATGEHALATPPTPTFVTNFSFATARAYAGHTDGDNNATTTTYVQAELHGEGDPGPAQGWSRVSGSANALGQPSESGRDPVTAPPVGCRPGRAG